MQTAHVSSPYSAKSLRALEQTLQIHRALVWIDPATNQLAVKRISPVSRLESVNEAPTMPA